VSGRLEITSAQGLHTGLSEPSPIDASGSGNNENRVSISLNHVPVS
jgi:hypothetical protein